MNDHTEAVLDYSLMRNALQAYTVTPMGKTLASQLHPHADATVLDVQLRETSEMAATLASGADPPLAPVVVTVGKFQAGTGTSGYSQRSHNPRNCQRCNGSQYAHQREHRV